MVQRLVEAQPQLEFDRAHFKAFGQSALEFEVVYIVKDPGFNLYMDLQQTLNLGLMRELAAMGVKFALPARTVHVAQMPAEPPHPLRVAPLQA